MSVVLGSGAHFECYPKSKTAKSNHVISNCGAVARNRALRTTGVRLIAVS